MDFALSEVFIDILSVKGSKIIILKTDFCDVINHLRTILYTKQKMAA